MRIIIDTPHDANADCALVVEAFQQWEATLSRFDPHSELNQLVRRPGTWQPVSSVLWDVLKTAAWAYERTHGLIDPTIRRSLEQHGYDTTFTAIQANQPPHPTQQSRWHEVRIDVQQPRVWLPADVSLDLAGVAKSWAAQQGLRLLTHYPAAGIDAAGDICLHGVPHDTPAWPIGIEALPGFVEPAMLALNGHAIATSGIDKRNWKTIAGTTLHHIIDPRTGTPATSDSIRASVIAPTLIEADVAARTLVILGHTEGFTWLDSLTEHAALVHTRDGNTHQSQRWESFVWPTESSEAN